MEWFSQNWVWVLFAFAMIAMHMGHGGHGGHCGGHQDDGKAGEADEDRASKQRAGHQH